MTEYLGKVFSGFVIIAYNKRSVLTGLRIWLSERITMLSGNQAWIVIFHLFN